MVEWKKLGDLGSYFGGLTGKTKEDFVNGNARFITYMNVFSNPSLNTTSTGTVRIGENEKQNKLQKGDILFTGSSETPEEAGMSCIVTEDLEGDYYMNSFCFGLRIDFPEKYNLHYLKYILRSNAVRKEVAKSASGVTRFNISKSRFGKILIPIPSLEEQERIVGILDTFTASIDNIKAQIEQRRKQYEHYRNTLLTFNKDDDSVEWKTLGEVAYYPQEKISASKLNKTNYVSVENLLQNKAGKVYSSCCPQEGNWKKYEIGDILIGNIRPNLRKIWLANIIGGTNGDVLTIRINDTYKHNISTNFLYYILSSEDFFLYDIQNAKGAKMPRGDKKVVLDYPIPLPSLQEQQHIVSILDTFDASITNLEAQLEQRQKQYEYYREELLTNLS